MLFSRLCRREEQTLGGGDDRQMQGVERERMLFSRTKSRHDYLEEKGTA